MSWTPCLLKVKKVIYYFKWEQSKLKERSHLQGKVAVIWRHRWSRTPNSALWEGPCVCTPHRTHTKLVQDREQGRGLQEGRREYRLDVSVESLTDWRCAVFPHSMELLLQVQVFTRSFNMENLTNGGGLPKDSSHRHNKHPLQTATKLGFKIDQDHFYYLV